MKCNFWKKINKEDLYLLSRSCWSSVLISTRGKRRHRCRWNRTNWEWKRERHYYRNKCHSRRCGLTAEVYWCPLKAMLGDKDQLNSRSDLRQLLFKIRKINSNASIFIIKFTLVKEICVMQLLLGCNLKSILLFTSTECHIRCSRKWVVAYFDKGRFENARLQTFQLVVY